MKKSTVLIALTLGSFLMLGATGCKHGPIGDINIPGHTIRPGSNPGDLGGGTPLPSTGGIQSGVNPVTDSNGLTPISDKDKWTDLMSKPHTEDREAFKNDTVYFDTDSAVIKTSEQAKLEHVASHFKDNAVDCLTIEGYCDERGTEGYNLALGDRRSLAVREYLITLGVESGRIHTVSFGEANPAEAGHNESAWKQNRRGFSVLIQPK